MNDRPDPSIADLCSFIDASPTADHAVETMAQRLTQAGFRELDRLQADWQLGNGGFFLRQGGALVAFALRGPEVRRFRLIGAHSDSPHLHLRSQAAITTEGLQQFSVEVYGGALLNSWLDRDLGLAGRVQLVDGTSRLIDIRRPLARVPQLAIHLDRRVNEDGLKLNPQVHLAPIWGIAAGDVTAAFLDLIARAAGVGAPEIAAHDLALMDITPARRGGAGDDLIFAGRLDNLASCHAGLTAILGATAGGTSGTVPVFAVFDHEEVGSTSGTGAAGPLLSQALERIALGLGGTRTGYFAALAGSLMLSADMAHAVHPNYPDRHDAAHKPQLGKGPVLKSNASQRYGTSAQAAAEVRRLARDAGVPLQDFASRGDIGCGTTIGPVTAAALGILVADLGSPMLSMHSARECAAAADHPRYISLLRAHLGA